MAGDLILSFIRMAKANETSPATASAHTEGPWTIINRDAAEPRIGGWLRPNEFGLVATVANETDGTAERQANARLIAAAPDLLEACEAALWDLTFDAPEAWEDEATRILRRAIDGAKGEEPSSPYHQ